MPSKDRDKTTAKTASAAALPLPSPATTSLAPTYGFPSEAFNVSFLPDANHEFIAPEDIKAFETALQAPDQQTAAQLLALQQQQQLGGSSDGPRSPKSPSSFSITRRDSHSLASGSGSFNEDYEDGNCSSSALATAAAAAAANGDFFSEAAGGARGSSAVAGGHGTFVTAQNDWAPVSSRFYQPRNSKRTTALDSTGSSINTASAGRRRRRRAKNAVEGILGTRSKDETRDGYLYLLAKWPLLLFVVGWLIALGVMYLLTRFYIVIYEQFFTWRGQREGLRRELRKATNYQDWVRAARALDGFLGRKTWREENDFAYYDSKTVKRVWDQMKKTRAKAEMEEIDAGTASGKTAKDVGSGRGGNRAVEELKALTEACVKNNFVGIDNPKLYSQTYYGTKNLVQNFVDEGKSPAIGILGAWSCALTFSLGPETEFLSNG